MRGARGTGASSTRSCATAAPTFTTRCWARRQSAAGIEVSLSRSRERVGVRGWEHDWRDKGAGGSPHANPLPRAGEGIQSRRSSERALLAPLPRIEEGAHHAPRLVGREGFGEGGDAALDGADDATLLPIAHERLLEGEGPRPGGEELRQRLGDGVVERRRRHDALDEAPALGLGGADRLAGEEEPPRPAPADEPRQQRRLDDRGNADPDFRHAEDRAVAGDAQIAGGGDFETGAERVAVDPRHDRYGQAAQPVADLVQRRDEGRGARRIERRHLAQIGAADESLVAGPAQHNRTQSFRRGQALRRGDELGHECAVEDVELARMVDGDLGDASLIEPQRDPGHAVLSRAAAMALLKARTAAAGPAGWFQTALTTARKSAPARTSCEQFSGVMPPIATQGTVIISLHQARRSGDGR